MTRDRPFDPFTIAALILIACLIVALATSYRKIGALKRLENACRNAALACPEIENKRIADITTNKPDGSITCEYYRPHGAHITRATVWPRPGEGAAK